MDGIEHDVVTLFLVGYQLRLALEYIDSFFGYRCCTTLV